MAEIPNRAIAAARKRGFDDGFSVIGEHVSNPYIVSDLSRAWDEGHANGVAARAKVNQAIGSIERDNAGMPVKLYPVRWGKVLPGRRRP